jgi:hypothetical protein
MSERRHMSLEEAEHRLACGWWVDEFTLKSLLPASVQVTQVTMHQLSHRVVSFSRLPSDTRRQPSATLQVFHHS